MRYVFGAIDQVTGQINAKQATLNSKLDELRHVISPLVADWEGAASESYQDKQRQWDSAALELNHVLESVGRAVGQGNADMQAREAANRGMFA